MTQKIFHAAVSSPEIAIPRRWMNNEEYVTVTSTLSRPTPTITTLIILAHIPNSSKAKRIAFEQKQHHISLTQSRGKIARRFAYHNTIDNTII